MASLDLPAPFTLLPLAHGPLSCPGSVVVTEGPHLLHLLTCPSPGGAQHAHCPIPGVLTTVNHPIMIRQRAAVRHTFWHIQAQESNGVQTGWYQGETTDAPAWEGTAYLSSCLGRVGGWSSRGTAGSSCPVSPMTTGLARSHQAGTGAPCRA